MTTMLTPLWPGFEYRDHQTKGIQWMLEQEKDEDLFRGGFLCDEMGLGKTMEVLGLLKNSGRGEHSLLLGPLAVIEQWITAAKNSGFNVFRVDPKRHAWVSEGKIYVGRPFFYITHYETINGYSYLVERKWHRLICDEAHRLVNPNSKSHQRVCEIEAKNRWVVTATPIINDIADGRALFAIAGMDPADVPYGKTDLGELIIQKAICRTVEELRSTIKELPKKEETTVHTLAFKTEDEEDFYRGIQGQLVKRFIALQNEGANYWAMIKLLILLRQISVHPQIYINARRRESDTYERDDWVGESTKTAAVKELIEAESDVPHRWLVFCQFHDEMDILTSSLRNLPRVQQVQTYSGKQTQAQREEVVQNTKRPFVGDNTVDILMVQLHSGSVGLNLQHFDRVIFISPWWTAALMDQAVGRAVRMGQTETVKVHHLQLQEENSLNIDELMLQAVSRKRELCNWFLDTACRGYEEEEDPQ